MTKRYKREVEALKRGSLKFAEEILENARQKSQGNDELNENSTMQALINPKHDLSEEEILHELRTLIVAVSFFFKLQNFQCLIQRRFIRDKTQVR